ncbi:MAG: hypothetical protein ACJ75B_19630 [Flavisolibacter sp.]
MKRLFLVLTLSLSLVSIRSFANGIEVSGNVLESFKNSFKNASDVSWSMVDHYYKASFVINDQHISAFFDQEGQIIAMTRNITTNQLPISLQLSLKKNYGNYWITDLFEMNDDQGISYYVSIENGDATVVLKSNTVTDWYSFKKMNK